MLGDEQQSSTGDPSSNSSKSHQLQRECLLVMEHCHHDHRHDDQHHHHHYPGHDSHSCHIVTLMIIAITMSSPAVCLCLQTHLACLDLPVQALMQQLSAFGFSPRPGGVLRCSSTEPSARQQNGLLVGAHARLSYYCCVFS